MLRIGDKNVLFMGSNLNIVTWADGTDKEIIAMVAAADAGKINLSDYWSVGDIRTVHLSATTKIEDEQDVELVLMHAGGYELANGKTCNFVVGQKDCLIKPYLMNSSDTNTGSWDSSIGREFCNEQYKNAIPNTLLPIFKQFKTITAVSLPISMIGESTTLQTSLDYFALPAVKEVFGGDIATEPGDATKESYVEEFNALFQFDWYKTSSNIIKNLGTDVADRWWMRSPPWSDDMTFCCNEYQGGGETAVRTAMASEGYGISPFGCI